MKKRIKIITILLCLSLVMLLPSVIAYMVNHDSISNDLVLPKVKCNIEETFDGKVKESISVVNESDIPVYIRVKIIHHWLDSKGDVVGKASKLPFFDYDAENWIKDGDIYYYKSPVSVNQKTVNLLAYGQTIVLDTDVQTEGNIEFVYNQAVEIHAEAIQAGYPEAVTNAWGVNVTNGIIQNN